MFIPDCIQDPDLDFLPILDPEFKIAPDPAVLRIRVRIRIHWFLGFQRLNALF
jgi:hypothetical protein